MNLNPDLNPAALHAILSILGVAVVFFLAGRVYESRRQRKHLVQAKRHFRNTLLHRAQADELNPMPSPISVPACRDECESVVPNS